ncbi:MAG TPA: hypothetical protein VFF72_04480, partial [Caldimonas sp.]|nr:hypothetical protein [Caldimonas sp.]
MVAVAVLIPALVWMTAPAAEHISIAPILAAALLIAGLMGVWTAIVFNVLLQNHPRTARIVPCQLRALRQALWSAAAFASAASAVICGLAGGPVLMTFACAVLACTVIAACMRWPIFWFAIILIASTTAVWIRSDKINAIA